MQIHHQFDENLSLAERLLKVFLEMSPEDDNALENLGEVLFHQDKKIESEKVFRKALEINPDNYQVWAYLEAYFREGND